MRADAEGVACELACPPFEPCSTRAGARADHVQKSHRGVWNSLESLQGGVFSVTAAIGGWLIGTFGYPAAFCGMASLFTLATTFWVALAVEGL